MTNRTKINHNFIIKTKQFIINNTRDINSGYNKWQLQSYIQIRLYLEMIREDSLVIERLSKSSKRE